MKRAAVIGIVLLIVSTLHSNKALIATLESGQSMDYVSKSVNDAINATYEAFRSPQNFNLSLSEAFNMTYDALVSQANSWFAGDDDDDDINDANNNRTQALQPLVDENGLDLDTSVIITSSLIPTHPSIAMINQTVHSLSHLQGLSPDAPIYITVDGLPVNTTEDYMRLQAYVRNLHYEYDNRTNIHILPSEEHRHIAGSIKMAVDRISTTFIYLVQHDFPFIKDIDHTNLRKSMEEFPQYIRNVRFEYKNRIHAPACTYWQQTLNITGTTPVDSVNGLHISLTRKWSDNNHFTTLKYYQDMLENLVMLKRPPEFPMMVQAAKNCSWSGQSVYGQLGGPGGYLRHLDGKRTANARRKARRF